MDACNAFFYSGVRSYYQHYLVHDVQVWFDKYDTLQWEDMVSELYQ
jgi:hypothetical protein